MNSVSALFSAGGFQWILLSLSLAFIVVYSLFYLAVGLYNLYFHPLARYPGPLLGRASSLWYARSLARGTVAQDTLKLHEKYGDVVRIAPDELSFIQPENWSAIYGHQLGKDYRELIKDPRYHDTVKPTPTILTGDWDEHTFYRKILSNSFSEKSLKDQEHILHHFVDLFVQRLKETSAEGTRELNMTDQWNYLTFDVIGFLAYGEEFHCLTSSKLHDWIEAMLCVAILMSLGQAARHLPFPFDKIYKQWAIPSNVKRQVALHRDLTEGKLQNRLQHEPQHQDVMKRMIALYKKGDIPYSVLKEHANILTIGGSETTATLLAGATFHLGKNPPVLQKLATEIRTTFANDGEITVARLSECKYLLATVEECLRIYPPSPANHTRMVPKEGIVLNDQHIPGGIGVGMPMYAAFRASSNFTYPDRFAPERWLGDPMYSKDKKGALQPFSFGPRNCLGRHLAYQEIKLALAKLVYHFDLELNPKCGDWDEQKNFTFWVKPPLWVNLHPVKS
ncbi:hypothetical protein AFCA_011456 [Aspergillus flavus]|uniref:Toxin biosynthesis cytochrome P450 monooxygenase n=1 Tax=Aspergillus flavus TaxID=5059 RepID=A0AB74BV57_ASPFL|nr:toxin biosynthesis cytochrome P450 monooxygenase [Aspergillus flavus]RAQ68685.1 toxin biosynthesis cytochrome P450 monooxygenase [Aspergillus flavus]RMZ37167.1 toxin biosynthesis cytochrome P450 monooxygenase [Aspergillus flavus]UDD64213.1 hypothetical protein AFCA_011456 [Aspergillus flavus]